MANWFSKFFRKKDGEHPGDRAGAAEATPQQTACGMAEFKRLFEGDETLVTRDFLCGDKRCCIGYIDGMVDVELINFHITEPLMRAEMPQVDDTYRYLLDSVIPADEVKRLTETAKIAEAVISGDTALFVEGAAGALTFNTKNWKTRSITEPESEKVTKGPREGFNESLMTNLTLIRRKLNTPDFKVKFRRIGRRSNTRMCVCYLKDLASQAVLDELDRRLNAIDVDSVLSVNYIDEMIRDSPMSFFITMGTTERPDVAAAKMLEGRVVVMVEGCPCALSAPYVFIEYFQAAEDYYGSFWAASIGRVMRIIGFVLTVTTPAIYLALVTMHQEMVPTTLLMAIDAARQQVPLPSVLELIVMLIVLEIMRESGARVPSFLGQSLSIVGGLVIGQAAVAARLISAPIIIVVALAAITSLLVPKLEGAAFVLRLLFVLITSVLGFYGLMIGMTAMFLHLLGIRSFGVPYLLDVLPLNMQEFKDTAIRMPWFYMIMRPRHISSKDGVRQGGRKI